MEKYSRAKGMEKYLGRHADYRGNVLEVVGGRVFPHVDDEISKDCESYLYVSIKDLKDWKLWSETEISRCRTQVMRQPARTAGMPVRQPAGTEA